MRVFATRKDSCGSGGLDGEAAVFVKENTDPGEMFYIHKDHLGSYQTITDENGSRIETLSFDPWGRRRNADTWSYSSVPGTYMFDRGFTGHEHLDAFELINMNGRIYDPVTTQFFNPDKFVQDQMNSQNFNRYSYALNNPLKYTDPSGWSYTPPVVPGTSFTNLGDYCTYLNYINSGGNRLSWDAGYYSSMDDFPIHYVSGVGYFTSEQYNDLTWQALSSGYGTGGEGIARAAWEQQHGESSSRPPTSAELDFIFRHMYLLGDNYLLVYDGEFLGEEILGYIDAYEGDHFAQVIFKDILQNPSTIYGSQRGGIREWWNTHWIPRIIPDVIYINSSIGFDGLGRGNGGTYISGYAIVLRGKQAGHLHSYETGSSGFSLHGGLGINVGFSSYIGADARNFDFEQLFAGDSNGFADDLVVGIGLSTSWDYDEYGGYLQSGDIGIGFTAGVGANIKGHTRVSKIW